MYRFSSFVAGLALSVFGIMGSASAFQVTNSLEPAPETETGVDHEALLANGYNFIKKDEIVNLVTDAGLTVLGEQASPKDNGLIVTTVVNNQLFLFAFFDCSEHGCFIMRPVHVIPTSNVGLRVTPGQVNELNVEFPFGNLMATPDGDVVLRTTFLAVPECAIQCLDAYLGSFFNATVYAHKLLRDQVGLSLVDGTDPQAPVSAYPASMTLTEVMAKNAQQADVFATPFEFSASGDITGSFSLKNVPGFEEWEVDWPTLLPHLQE